MELLEMIQQRKSIRKYLNTKVEKEKLDKILEAGIYALNPGGRQGTKIIMLDNAAMIEKNRHCFGYINGEYPKVKPRNEERAIYISED